MTAELTTLRMLNGFDRSPARLAESTLVLVDFQNTYTTGVMELAGWRDAIEHAAKLLQRARELGTPVIHVVNDGGEGTPYDIRAEIGQIHPQMAPRDGEPVVVKHVPNGFVDTELGAQVDAAGRSDLVVAGFMTHMCVQFTAQGAFLRGQRPTVVAQACATRDLPNPTGTVEAAAVHAAALGTIGDLFGVVVESADDLG